MSEMVSMTLRFWQALMWALPWEVVPTRLSRAADVVFMTSSMEAIPQSIAIAKATGTIAMQNVVFALAVKILVMILGLAGFANMWMAVICGYRCCYALCVECYSYPV